MSTPAAPALVGRPGPSRRHLVRDHLGSPQTRAGYALLASSAITSVLGLLYWVVAARHLSEEMLGRGAAMLSAMLLVATLATAGLKRGLIRFLPTAGASRRRIVAQVYATGVGLGVLIGAALLLLGARLGERPEALESTRAVPVFLASVAIWCLFVLQDAVLVGVGRATVVPVANGAFSVLKIGVVLGGGWLLAEDWVLLASWVAPALVAVAVVNAWLRRRGLLTASAHPDEPPVSVRQLVRFTGADYVATLAWQTANHLTPLLVVAHLGAAANARYYVASQIAYALFLVSSNLTDALVAHGAAVGPGQSLAPLLRRSAVQLSVLLVPAIGFTVLAAPLIMGIFGAGYEGDSVVVLRVLAVAAAPNAVSTLMVAVNHVRRRLALVVTIQATMAALTLLLVVGAIETMGIEGVALAWLVAQSVTAVVAVALTARAERASGRSPGPDPDPSVEEGRASGDGDDAEDVGEVVPLAGR